MRDPKLSTAAEYVRSRIQASPDIGLILGSGLSDLAEVVSDPVVIETTAVPNYPTSTVQGHKGRLVFGYLGSKYVVFVQGRLHVYEGHSLRSATFPVRLLAELGATKLIVTNAAGGINSRFYPGTLMWITDHINFSLGSVFGSGDRNEDDPPHPRARPQVHPYDLEWTARARAIAHDLGIVTEQGTYLWTRGPSYETKAEIEMFSKLGADAVGMSTVPEVIEAASFGMSILGLSTITNLAAGLGHESLNHEEVLQVGQRVRHDLQRLLSELIKAI